MPKQHEGGVVVNQTQAEVENANKSKIKRFRQGTVARRLIALEQKRVFKPILPRTNAKRMIHDDDGPDL